MCEESVLSSQLGTPLGTVQGGLYFPPAYSNDGFVHACSDPSELIPVGNHFYKSSKEKWVCMQIDVSLLDCEIKFEPRELHSSVFWQ